MSIITDGLPYTDRLGNEIYTDFRGVMKAQEKFDDPDLTNAEKWMVAIGLIYGDLINTDGTPIETPLTALAREIMWFCSGGEEVTAGGKQDGKEKPRLHDFEQDEDYIIGGFQQAYGLDLTDETLALHWWRFLALFRSLPENTEMAHRVQIRAMDTSKMKGNEKRRYDEMKRSIAIKHKSGGMKKLSLRERLLLKQKEFEG